MNTNNLTRDEREQRLKEVRRARELGILPWSHLSNPTQRFEVARDTIAFLLSLIDSEAAGGRPIGWVTAKVCFDSPAAVRMVFESPECAQAFIDGIEPVFGPVTAATAMRDLCVEKVGSVCDEYKADLFSTDDEIYKASLGFAVDALDRTITKMSSLTLDQVEQKRK